MLEYFSLKKRASTVVRQIMVATDGSGGADRAVDFAAELAKAAGCALSIITDLPGLFWTKRCERLGLAKELSDAEEAV